jgi:transcriptional regulator with XRE-family HTH domain
MPAARHPRGHTIRDARRAAGLTQAELAERLGTAQTHVSRWERSWTPDLLTLIRIAQALGMSLVVDAHGAAVVAPGSIRLPPEAE